MEDSGAEDGVYLFRPHTSYISGLRWLPLLSHPFRQLVHAEVSKGSCTDENAVARRGIWTCTGVSLRC